MTEGVKRRVAVILSADVAGYSRLMEDDEQRTVQTMGLYRKTVTSLIEQHSGADDNPKAIVKILDIVNRCFAKDKDPFWCQLASSLANLCNKEHEEAANIMTQLIALAPGYADLHAMLARIYGYAGKSEKALEAISKALQLNTKSPSWYFPILANVYRQSGQNSEALNAYKKALESDPWHSAAFTAHLGLAIQAITAHHQDNAEAEAAEILKLVPNFSVDVYGERIPYKDPAQAERDMAALRKAGLK